MQCGISWGSGLVVEVVEDVVGGELFPTGETSCVFFSSNVTSLVLCSRLLLHMLTLASSSPQAQDSSLHLPLHGVADGDKDDLVGLVDPPDPYGPG